MKILRQALILLFICVPAFAARTFYIAGTGADTNNGTAKGTPWKHAPGMPNCANTCAAYTAQVGDSFIFRGGDTYHINASTNTSTDTPVGGPWNLSGITPGGGSTTGGNGCTGTGCYYVGVDQTWYAGASWVRPVITGDNPTSTLFVGSCTHDFSASQFVNLGSGSYIIFDNFELLGICVSANPGFGDADYIVQRVTHSTISNVYFHGWTETNTQGNDYITMINGLTTATVTNNLFTLNVMDGTDAVCPNPPTYGGGTGWGVYGDSFEVSKNVFRCMGNGLNSPSNFSSIHDNLFENMSESFDLTNHGALIESNLDVSAQPIYIYNNTFRHNRIGSGVWPEPVAANLYFFNNVDFDFQNSGSSSNCFMVDGQGASGTAVNVYSYNDTIDAACNFRFYGSHSGQEFHGTGFFENDHFIGYSPLALTSVYTIDSGAAGSTTITDNGHEIFQSEATANGQGYVAGNNYAPTLISNATVGAGANLSSFCSAIADANAATACASGTSGGVSNTAGTGNAPTYPAITINSRGTTFDAGAYQFGSQASPSSCSPGSGTYSSTQTVSLNNPNTGTTVVCYNTTGSPATSGDGVNCPGGSTKYTTPLSISANETLYSVAGTSTLTDSSVTSCVYAFTTTGASGTIGNGAQLLNGASIH
jgi:hypothetical protein